MYLTPSGDADFSAVFPSPLSWSASLSFGSLLTQLILWFYDGEYRRAPHQQQDQERKRAGSPLLPSPSHCADVAVWPTNYCRPKRQQNSPACACWSNFLLCLLGICLLLAPSPWGCKDFSCSFSIFCQWEQLKHRDVVALALNCTQAPIPHAAVSGSPSFCKTNRWLCRRPRHWGKERSAEVAAGGKIMFYTCQAGALDKADLTFILVFYQT